MLNSETFSIKHIALKPVEEDSCLVRVVDNKHVLWGHAVHRQFRLRILRVLKVIVGCPGADIKSSRLRHLILSPIAQYQVIIRHDIPTIHYHMLLLPVNENSSQ